MPQIDPDNGFSPRHVFWHDRFQTRQALERLGRYRREVGELVYAERAHHDEHALFQRLATVWPGTWRAGFEHLQHWACRALWIGNGRAWLTTRLQPGGEDPWQGAARGYVSLEDDLARADARGQAVNPFALRREDFLARESDWTEAVTRMLDADRDAGRVVGESDWFNPELATFHDLELWRAIAREARGAGIELVLLVPPETGLDRAFEARLEQELGLPLLRYNDPERYPEFYAPAARFDSGHPLAPWATRFSARFAADLARLLQSPPAGGVPGEARR